MAKVLVIGSGGREHAICYKFKQSALVDEVFIAPGSYGMSDVATVCNIAMNDHDKLISFVRENEIDLTFVGPEIALVDGIVDAFETAGLKIFGPRKNAARLEGSKVFSKYMMEKYNVPTAKYQSFKDYESAKEYLLNQQMPIVLKADGLAAGKGVIICNTMDDALVNLKAMMCDKLFADAGSSIVIEEFLDGYEFSLLSFVKDNKAYPMQVAQDHKRAFDNDQGLNTGGMGAYTPVDMISQKHINEAYQNIVLPILDGMIAEGCPFTGILYAGCMVCNDKVYTIEYNVRFGDPECEVILLALKNDLYQLITDILDDKPVSLEFDDNYYCGVVLASKGYPENYEKNHIINGLQNVETTLFHMGTGYVDGNYVTNGGRVLFVVGKGNDLKSAQKNAYDEIAKIHCDNLFYRKDIGAKSLKN